MKIFAIAVALLPVSGYAAQQTTPTFTLSVYDGGGVPLFVKTGLSGPACYAIMTKTMAPVLKDREEEKEFNDRAEKFAEEEAAKEGHPNAFMWQPYRSGGGNIAFPDKPRQQDADCLQENVKDAQ